MNKQNEIMKKIGFFGALSCSLIYFSIHLLSFFIYFFNYKSFSGCIDQLEPILKGFLMYNLVFPVIIGALMILCLVFIKTNSKLLLIPSILLFINSFQLVSICSGWLVIDTVFPIIGNLILTILYAIIVFFQSKKKLMKVSVFLLILFIIIYIILSIIIYPHFRVKAMIFENLIYTYYIFTAIYLYFENKSKQNESIDVKS